MRRAGQQHNHLAIAFDPLAGSGAAAVRQWLGAFDDERLAPIVVGHFALQAMESFRQGIEQILAKNQTAAQSLGDGIACHVVFGRS